MAGLVRVIVGLLAFGAAGCLGAGAAARPSVVFFLADDLGWGDLGCYGAAGIRTPHIDGLAREGVRFTQFYSNGPECSPTRAAFLTGRYQQRVGGLECAIGIGGVGRYDDAIRLAQRKELGLPGEEISIARLLRDSGYATALIGKWHLGYEGKFSPNRHGFEHALYCLGGGMDYFHHVEDPPGLAPALRRNGEPVQRAGYFTDLIAEECVGWLKAQAAGRPLFLYVPFTAPHAPYQAPGDASAGPLPADSPRWKQAKTDPGVYAAMVERMDWAVGRVLEAFAAARPGEEPLVIFASDNGGTVNALPCGLREKKGTTFEGGIRVPCIARWRGRLPVGVAWPHPGITMDLTASIAGAAGAAASEGRAFDGIDLLGCIARGEAPPARALYWRGRRGEITWRAVRDGALKYVARADGAQTEEFLFDVENDIGEERDLLGERGADAARLRALLTEWESAVKPAR